MAGISVTIDDGDVRNALRALMERARAPQQAMAAIGQALVTDADLTFREQSDPWGNPWDELSEVTIARRRQGPRSDQADQILRDTGRLANSIHYRADHTGVTVGTDVIYARVHQLGNPENRFFGRALAPIPARPFLPFRNGRIDLPTSARDDILHILSRYLQDGHP